MLRKSNPWPEEIQAHSNYREQDVRPCARDLFMLLDQMQNRTTLDAVKKKFALPKFGEVSRMRLMHANNQGTPSTVISSQNSSIV
jgi:predicted ribonuclease YlaK